MGIGSGFCPPGMQEEIHTMGTGIGKVSPKCLRCALCFPFRQGHRQLASFGLPSVVTVLQH